MKKNEIKTNKKVTKSGDSKKNYGKKIKSAKEKLKAHKKKLQNRIIKKEAEIIDGICGNCGNELGDKDKYCHLCGTKRGDGDFLPDFNDSVKVYGPPISYYYKCKKCNHKWKVKTLLGKDESKYCPNCGAKQIENTKTKEW